MTVTNIQMVEDAMSIPYRMPGKTFARYIQAVHNLKCLRRIHFDDLDVRVRANVILYAPAGCVKSTTSSFMLTHLFGAKTIAEARAEGTGSTFPIYHNIGSGTTFERTRGGFTSKGSLIPPIAPLVDYLYAPELMSALGHNAMVRGERMEFLNNITEEGHVQVSLIKGLELDLEKRKEVAAAIPKNAPYRFDPDDAILEYQCSASFIGCTRHLEQPLLSQFKQSGYWSRHLIAEFSPSSSGFRAYLDSRFGPPMPKDVLSKLARRNLHLWNSTFDEVLYPDRSIVGDVVRHINLQYDQMCEEFDISIVDAAGERDHTSAAHAIVANAVGRVAATIDSATHIRGLEYTEEDAEFAKSLLGERLAIQHAQLLSAMDEKSKRSASDPLAIEAIKEFTRHRFSQGEDYPDLFHSSQFHRFVVHELGKSEKTGQRYLKNVKDRGHIAPTRGAGYYRISEEVMESMGMTTSPAAEAW